MQVNRIVAALACLCPLVPCGSVSAQTDAGLWRFVHPNAKALIGIDVRAIAGSRIAGEMAAQFHSLAIPFPLPAALSVMDPINSIDRVLLSSPGADPADLSAEPPVIIAAAGRFEPGKLARIFMQAGAKPQFFDGVTIYRPPEKNSDFGVVVLNSQTLLAGDAKSLYTVLDRISKNVSTIPAIVERARDMDVAYDFWAILSAPPSAMHSDRFPLASLAGKMTGFQAGIALRDGLALDVNITAASEAGAKEMSTQLSKLLRLVTKDRDNHPEWAGLNKKFKITIENSDVHIALRVAAPDVERMAKVFEEARARGQQASIAPKPPARQVIRIEGLDDGPREVPYRPPNP